MTPLPEHSDVPSASVSAPPDGTQPTSSYDYVVPKETDLPFGYDTVYAPWATKRYPMNVHGLNEEFLDVYHWLRPSALEVNIRFVVFQKWRRVIEARWSGEHPSVLVRVFGSLSTRLFLPSSDIDVLVECADWPTPPLDETADAILATGMADEVKIYKEAFVPIVKIVDKDTKISIDISFNTVQGVKAAEFIEKAKASYPALEPLALVLKQFLIQRHLNQTYSGGLSSYGLILMCISFLQMYAKDTSNKAIEDPTINYGVLLIRFFEVYGQELNYMHVGLIPKEFCYRLKSEKDQSMLSIQDPLLETNEVGRSSFNVLVVRCAFEKALALLRCIFVRDRPHSAKWKDVYKGSMMAPLLPFSQQQLHYRSWLKGFSMSLPCQLKKGEPSSDAPVMVNSIITTTLLADTVSITQEDYQTLSTPKPSQPLEIVDPNAKKRQKGEDKTPEEQREKGESRQEAEQQEDETMSMDETLNLPDLGDLTLTGDEMPSTSSLNETLPVERVSAEEDEQDRTLTEERKDESGDETHTAVGSSPVSESDSDKRRSSDSGVKSAGSVVLSEPPFDGKHRMSGCASWTSELSSMSGSEGGGGTADERAEKREEDGTSTADEKKGWKTVNKKKRERKPWSKHREVGSSSGEGEREREGGKWRREQGDGHRDTDRQHTGFKMPLLPPRRDDKRQSFAKRREWDKRDRGGPAVSAPHVGPLPSTSMVATVAAPSSSAPHFHSTRPKFDGPQRRNFVVEKHVSKKSERHDVGGPQKAEPVKEKENTEEKAQSAASSGPGSRPHRRRDWRRPRNGRSTSASGSSVVSDV